MQTVLTKKQIKKIAGAKTLNQLYSIAKQSIKKAKKNYPTATIIQACGPITSGGKGNRDANLVEFNKAIIALTKLQYLVFNQMPYEDKIGEIVTIITKKAKRKFAYCMDVLLDFYEPLFEKKYTNILIFLPGWEDSTGACWEYTKGKKLGIKTLELKENWEELIAKGETSLKKLTIKI